MKTKHQSINQESVNNVEVQDWWVQQALTIHIFWEKIKTSCSIDGTHSGGRDWDYVGDAGRHLRGWRHGHFHGSHHSYDLWSLVTISFLIIFSEKLFLVGDHYRLPICRALCSDLVYVILFPQVTWKVTLYIQGGFFNWSAQFSVPKWKNLLSQRGPFLHWKFREKLVLVGCNLFFILVLKIRRTS